MPKRNPCDAASSMALTTPCDGLVVVERALDRMWIVNPPPTYGCRLLFPTMATTPICRRLMPSNVTPFVPDRPAIVKVSVSAWKDCE